MGRKDSDKRTKQKCEKARNKTSKPVKGRAQNKNQVGAKSRIVNKDQDKKQELEQEENKEDQAKLQHEEKQEGQAQLKHEEKQEGQGQLPHEDKQHREAQLIQDSLNDTSIYTEDMRNTIKEYKEDQNERQLFFADISIKLQSAKMFVELQAKCVEILNSEQLEQYKINVNREIDVFTMTTLRWI